MSKKSLAIILLLIIPYKYVSAQGCVAIRHFSTCSGNPNSSLQTGKGYALFSANYRYFKSFRHFRGTQEEPDRVANGSEVINNSHSLDLNFTYGLGNKIFVTANLPLVYNERSSLYEHGRTERHSSFSKGLGDARIGLGYWVKDVRKAHDANMSINLGIKLPTGQYDAASTFYNVGPNGNQEVRPVDQSIQPGDGGFGITFGLQGFKQIGTRLSVYGSGFYLSNPREVNNTRTFRETLSPVLQNESIMSVADQYSISAGLSYSFFKPNLSLSLGGRFEGVPVEDLIGGSLGFRRPGMAGSLDPGIMFMKNQLMFSLNVPIALYRNRPQSLTDLETEKLTGTPRAGDAAFADYLINFGLTIGFGNKDKSLQLK
jgi:hypothetical protein